MKLTEEIIKSLCECEDLRCQQPHTIKELEMELGEEFEPMDTIINPNCPICKVNKDVTTYTYKGKLEAYCSNNGCNVNFNPETGKILDIEDMDDLPTTTVSLKHIMSYDNQIHKCLNCTFETVWQSEANAHEQSGSLVSKIINSTTEEPHYTKYKSVSLWVCENPLCKQEFGSWQLATSHENDAGKKKYGTTTYTTATYTAHCVHKPREVLHGEKWSIWAGRKWDCEDSLNKFNVVLNLSGNRVSKRHEIPISILKKWESKEKFKEICLDWPDRGIVSLPKQFWTDLGNYIKNNNFKMVIFCIGGHGRTGTAVASLLVTMFGWEPKAATEWVWSSYCDQAIETNAQIQYCYGLVGQTYVPPNETKTQDKPAPSGNNQTALITGWNND